MWEKIDSLNFFRSFVQTIGDETGTMQDRVKKSWKTLTGGRPRRRMEIVKVNQGFWKPRLEVVTYPRLSQGIKHDQLTPLGLLFQQEIEVSSLILSDHRTYL